MGFAAPDLSVVVVAYQAANLLEECLDASIAAAGDVSLQRIVVDNGSTDGTAALAHGRLGVETISLPTNRGFAAAANVGAARARGRYLAFVNTDAAPEPRCLESQVALLDATGNQRVGIVSGALYYPDGRRQRTAPEYPSRRPLPQTPTDVSHLRGACLVVRATAFAALEGFDERFFFYMEETDLCLRAWRAGWRVVLDPGVRVLHRGGATASRWSGRARVERARARYLFRHKHHGAPSMVLSALGGGLAAAVRTLVAGATLIATAGLSARARRRSRDAAYLLAWHLAGLPADWGLAGLAVASDSSPVGA